jgi:hypothetical protein
VEFRFRYQGKSTAASDSQSTELSFTPDSLRPPTYFVGQLHKRIAFREAISALHDVVVSDQRFKPRDQTEYRAWLAQHEQAMLAEFIESKGKLSAEMATVRGRLQEMYKQGSDILQPFYKAQRRYWEHLYLHDRDTWILLDPVISVHPDELFFECFSEDESSYGKLSCSHNVFKNISDKAFGTTNIDYSDGLYAEFQKIREYKETSLTIDPGGFSVTTGKDDQFEEKKIDLPDGWVRGFLQVSSAMTLPMVSLRLHPMDVHNLCYLLRRRKERVGPRSLRFKLTPGEPVRISLDPWNTEIICARSPYTGPAKREIRVWGRRRLHILERLIPVANHFTVHLMGDGLPSFYVADLGDMSFTLGLSGWTANDWSRVANFDLLAPRGEVDEFTLRRVYAGLAENWCETSQSLARRLNLDEPVVKSALAAFSQRGQVLFDLASGLYRIRELRREPIPFDQLRFGSEKESKAERFVSAGLVKVKGREHTAEGMRIHGTAIDDAVTYHCSLVVDDDQRMRDASCECFFFKQNRLRKGPCEHLLALRRADTGPAP